MPRLHRKLTYFTGHPLTAAAILTATFLSPAGLTAEIYSPPEVDGLSIKAPLHGLSGSATRGQQVLIARDRGNCLACHALPIAEEPFHGTVGPPLTGIATRLSEGEIRLRIVDQQRINPHTIMPGFYKNPKQLRQVLYEYSDTTILTAQEVEDVVAYLLTLK
jgi:sulfur-oxidizing protein SoxX